MNVLVTGGTGYLGQAVVRALADAGHTPVVFSRSASRSGLPGRLVNGDVRDRHAVFQAAEGCTAICHLAALVSVWRVRAAEFDEVTVGGLRNVLAVAAARSVGRILYTSSFMALPPNGSASPRAWNDYQRTKVAADAVARAAAAAGAPLVRLYPGVVYGPGPLTAGNLVGNMVADHLAGRLPGIVGASCRWSYAFIDDVARAYVKALERESVEPEYRLCGENAPQMRVFEIVRGLTGRQLPRRIPGAIAVAGAVVEELRARLTRRPPILTLGTVEVLLRDWAYDSDAAMRDLDYRITPLSDGLPRTLTSLWAAQGHAGGPAHGSDAS
jgi:NAD+-dependent farnesol dehydrogenase